MTELSERQMDLLTHIAATGHTIEMTADELGMSRSTARNHLSAAYRRLGVSNMTSAFVVLGWLRPKDVAADLPRLQQDLLWAMWAFSRLAYPMAIGDLFDALGHPELRAEYEAVADHVAQMRRAR